MHARPPDPRPGCCRCRATAACPEWKCRRGTSWSLSNDQSTCLSWRGRARRMREKPHACGFSSQRTGVPLKHVGSVVEHEQRSVADDIRVMLA